MNAETFFNNGFGEDCEKVHKNHVIKLMQNYAEHYYNEQLRLHDVVRQSDSGRFYSVKEIETIKEECYQDGLEDGQME